jgi:hypothetical protein
MTPHLGSSAVIMRGGMMNFVLPIIPRRAQKKLNNAATREAHTATALRRA